jgi:hypothetical protein
MRKALVERWVRRARGPRGRGQSLVEFSLILPGLLLLIMGIIDFGRVMVIFAGISNGAREAVRFGAVPGKRFDGLYNFQDCDAMRNAVRAAVPLQTIDDDEIWLGYDLGYSIPPTDTIHECPPISPNDVPHGARVLALVDVNVPLLTPLINRLVPAISVKYIAARTVIKDPIETGPTSTPPPWPPPTWTPRPADPTRTPRP